MRVLLVEDEPRLAANLAAALREGPGFAVDQALDGETADEMAAQMAAQRGYDLVILDLMLPKLDGQSVLRRIRARRDPTPVLILTAKDGKNAIVELLNSGADDYLAKPFDPRNSSCGSRPSCGGSTRCRPRSVSSSLDAACSTRRGASSQRKARPSA